MSATAVDKSELWRTIAYYYAFAECIECRLSALRSSRDYKRFYGEVYRYAFSLFLELDNQTHEQFAARLWKYCADVQCAYKEQLLRQKDIAEADKELLRTLTTRLGRHAHESREGIRRAYTLLVKVDGCKCEFAEMLQKKDRKGAIEFPVGVLHRMDEYITHLNETFARYLNLEKKIGAYIEHVKSIEESDRPPEERLPPFPTNIVASMFVFVSHLGRAAIHQCADAAKPVADATKELEKSLLHLDRAIMDAHKMLVLRLRHPDTRRYFRKHMPPDMWRTIVMARCLEHDRLTHDHKEFTARIRQYSKLFPVADRILADLDGRLARIQTH